MPLISTLAAIGGLLSAGVTSGLAIDNAVNAPGAPPNPSALTPPTAAQQQQTATQQKAAVSQQLPTLEGLTSGYANPQYYAQQGAAVAGTAGAPGGSNSALQAVEQAFGLPPGSLAGGGGGGTPPVQPYTPAGTGDTSKGAFPSGQPDLTNFVNSFIST